MKLHFLVENLPLWCLFLFAVLIFPATAASLINQTFKADVEVDTLAKSFSVEDSNKILSKQETSKTKKHYAYKITHAKKYINCVVATKGGNGYVQEGYAFYGTSSNNIFKVALKNLCLKKKRDSIEYILTKNVSNCDIAYFKHMRFYTREENGYFLNEYEKAVLVDTFQTAVVVKSDFILLNQMSRNKKKKECLLQKSFWKSQESPHKKCSKDIVILKYQGNKPIKIAEKLVGDSLDLVLFYSRNETIILSGNYVFCGLDKNGCDYLKFKKHSFIPYIMFQSKFYDGTRFETVFISYKNQHFNITCNVSSIIPFTKDIRKENGQCNEFAIVGTTVYDTFRNPVIYLNEFGHIIFNNWVPWYKTTPTAFSFLLKKALYFYF